MKQLAIILLLLGNLIQGACQGRNLDNVFYCFNNGVRGLPNAPESPEEQAALMKKLGYDGLAGHATQDNIALRDALDKEGLLMPEVYYGLKMDGEGNIDIPAELKELIKVSGNRGLLVALTLTGESNENKNDEIDMQFVDEIRKLAEFAAGYKVDIALYPHVDLYLEESIHSVKLAQEVNRDNVGVIFNTCHFLKVEGEKGWKKKVKNTLPWLRMVSINGADSGDTRNMGWDQLIQPLGEGSYDTYKLVKFLNDNGYEGLFGLQCYGIQQDCETALSKSISTWRSYRGKYSSE
jgi:sugar phosphate isomerase/epimerase